MRRLTADNIRDIAIKSGFKLKEQPNGEMDLNPYVFDFAQSLTAELEKRLAEVERERDKLRCAVATAIDVFDDYDMDVETYAPIKHVKMKQGLHDSLNKFAIEQQIKALENFSEKYCDDEHSFLADKVINQLRQQLGGETE